MGCASSTPMVATAGSEMLKAATHVAGDVKQKGEGALEDATQALNATMDTTKETVSTAVAGITNELGNAFKDGTEALDEAKHKVLESLHLEGSKPTEGEGLSTSRAPTPALDADTDSLKTSTPEPEIERALANSSANEDEAPPTPKPSLQEMAKLSAQVATMDDAVATTTTTTTTIAAEIETAAGTSHVERRWYRRSEEAEEEQRRPSTTEWEKLADQLAKSRKFKPYESFAHSQNQFSVYQDHTSLRDKPGHYDGHFSGGNSLETSASQSHSDLSSGHLTPAPPTRRGHRDYAKFVGSEQPGSVSRTSSRLSNVGVGRAFDFNPQRERINLPIANARNAVGSRVGSALNGRRSLWARGSHDVVPEEPQHTYSPLRRSSMTVGRTAVRDERNLQVARSTSNLTSSSLQRQKEAKTKNRPRQSLEDVSRKPLPRSKPINAPDRQLRAELKSERVKSSKSQKQRKEVEDSLPVKADLHEAFKSMLLDSARDISSTVLLATPPKTSAMPHSPSPAQQPLPVDAATSNKMPTPLASRSSTFIAATTESRNSAVKYATPTKAPQQQTPTRLHTAAWRAEAMTASPRHATNGSTTAKTVAGFATPTRTSTPVKSQSPLASRLSSASSAEVVIKPLSHLNTPSVVSISPESCQVVMTEYEDNDLEAALARLADWRGSTTTLHSLSGMGHNSLNSSHFDSRRTSPWLRRPAEHGHSKERRTFSSCGIAELASPSKAAPLERCEICCNEIVMN
ncbi:hypothetical protein KR044_011202 [Drosophila immigrans]|nr:hypothetical protein KR044_011202 [Drosophila immigrans]